jgi:hypothetical protein
MGAWGYAFSISNHSTETRDISVSFEASKDEVESYLGFGIEEGGWGARDAIEIEGTQTEDSVEFTGVEPGQTLYVSFVVDTTDVNEPAEEDLDGALTVDAN